MISLINSGNQSISRTNTGSTDPQKRFQENLPANTDSLHCHSGSSIKVQTTRILQTQISRKNSRIQQHESKRTNCLIGINGTYQSIQTHRNTQTSPLRRNPADVRSLVSQYSHTKVTTDRHYHTFATETDQTNCLQNFTQN